MRKATFRFAAIAIGFTVMVAMTAQYAAAQTVGPPAPGTQIPQPQDNNVNWPGAGYGVGALLCNVLYIPAKLTYAVVGGVVGGGTYLVTAGNQQAANTVWRSSFGGDYVVTPQMLAGQQPLNFSGPTATPPDNVAPAPSTTSSSSTTMTTTASSGSVAPITPIPPAGATASNPPAAGQPLDHGAGPSPSGSNIE